MHATLAGVLAALFNAGVAIDAPAIRTLAFPVQLGIMAGLVLGKPAGILVASWLAVMAGLATLPEGASWRHVGGTAWLAGIGFTMALYISGLAFPGTALERQAKLGRGGSAGRRPSRPSRARSRPPRRISPRRGYKDVDGTGREKGDANDHEDTA